MIAVLGLPNVVSVAVVVGIVAVIFRSRVFGANDASEISWLDAWLKAMVIVVAVAFFTVYVPSWAIQTDAVTDMDRNAQDLIGAGLFGLALVATLWALWYAHREKRV